MEPGIGVRPVKKPWSIGRIAKYAVAGVAVLYLTGFVAFMSALPEPVDETKLGKADGIVALTGEDARLGPAVALLEDGAAPRLLISGVFPGTTKADLKELTHGGTHFDCCVDLGFAARDTRGNAHETARWTRAHRMRSLIVVTASYHMPRSMVEFSAAMPEVKLIAYPVETDPPKPTFLRRWMRMQGEYAKFLATEAWILVGGEA